MITLVATWLSVGFGASGLQANQASDEPTVPPRIELRPFLASGRSSDWLHGTLEVYESRAARRGRKISLHVVVLPATGERVVPDPIFVLHGGPGAAATQLASGWSQSPMRQERDIVLVDQRGTGRSNPLRVKLPGSDDNLQGYLDPIFRINVFRAARVELERVADLRFYTTPIAMDDLDDVRAALGYGQINLVGGSYGTRAALVYMRRHEKRVRTATLMGVAPISFINPLYHARSAQEGLERIFEECAADPIASKAFPRLEEKFHEVLARLEEKPARVTIAHPGSGKPATVTLDREAFCEALRIMMYYMRTNRKVPLLIYRAWEGDYEPFARTGVESNRSIRGILSFGMLMSVVGSEDIPRIEEEAIVRETQGTFLGDGRVRRQIAASKIWPRGEVPDRYGEPVRVKTPTLLISGTHDPVTPPRWGAEAARHLPNSLLLVVPAVHGSYGPAVERIKRDFLDRGTVEGLDVSGAEETRLPPFDLGGYFVTSLKIREEGRTNTWHGGPHSQFGVTAVLCEGAGGLHTKQENLDSGVALIRGIAAYYKGTKP
jgi:pimeloyl-ACP methyl ester carboxylesterase